jgi:hypothetical protein
MNGPRGYGPRRGMGGPMAGNPYLFAPQVEAWHGAQVERTLGLASAAAGIALFLLGVVRTLFSLVERRYAVQDGPTYSGP